MYNQNPYGELSLSPQNYAKVVPSQQAVQTQYAPYIPQYQIQQPVPQAQLLFPQLEPNTIINGSNLLQYSNNSEKKYFIMKVAFIGLIQQIMMLIAFQNSSDNKTLRKIYYENEVVQWPVYLLISITITSIFLCRFLKPAKDYFLQVAILVGMTLLYVFSASAVSIVLYYYKLWPLTMLFSQSLAFVSVLISQAINYKNERIFQKFINIQFFLVAIPVAFMLIFFSPINDNGYLTLFAFIVIFGGLIVLGWSLCFGLLFLYSIEQLINGKFNLEKSDFLAASTIVYGNMVTPIF